MSGFSEFNEHEECMVCMDAYPSRIINCGHRFCKVCIVKIIKEFQNPNCPKCRGDILKMVSVRKDSDDDEMDIDKYIKKRFRLPDNNSRRRNSRRRNSRILYLIVVYFFTAALFLFLLLRHQEHHEQQLRISEFRDFYYYSNDSNERFTNPNLY